MGKQRKRKRGTVAMVKHKGTGDTSYQVVRLADFGVGGGDAVPRLLLAGYRYAAGVYESAERADLGPVGASALTNPPK